MLSGISRGSFSGLWTPIFARTYSLCGKLITRSTNDLKTLRTISPRRPTQCSKDRPHLFRKTQFECSNLMKFCRNCATINIIFRKWKSHGDNHLQKCFPTSACRPNFLKFNTGKNTCKLHVEHVKQCWLFQGAIQAASTRAEGRENP